VLNVTGEEWDGVDAICDRYRIKAFPPTKKKCALEFGEQGVEKWVLHCPTFERKKKENTKSRHGKKDL